MSERRGMARPEVSQAEDRRVLMEGIGWTLLGVGLAVLALMSTALYVVLPF